MLKTSILILFLILTFEHVYAYTYNNPSDSLEIYSEDTLLISSLNKRFLIKFIGCKEGLEHYNFFGTVRLEISNLNDSIPFQTIQDTIVGIYDYELVDVNLDGILDIQVDEPMTASGVNTPCNFWFYDSNVSKFVKSKEFSELCNVYIDTVKKEVNSEWNWGGRQGSYSKTFKINNGHLKLIEENEYDHGNETHKILKNDSLIIDEQTIIDDVKDENGNWIILETDKDLVDGKLEIIRKITKKYFDGVPSSEQIDSGFVTEDFSGRYLIIKEELFSYKKDINNKRKVYIKIRKVINNKWGVEDKIVDYSKLKRSN